MFYSDPQCRARPPKPVKATTGLVFLGMDMIGRQGCCHKSSHIAALFFSFPDRGFCKLPPTPPTFRFSCIPILNQHFGQGIVARIAHTRLIKFGDSNSNCGNIIGSYNRIVHGSDGGAQIMRSVTPHRMTDTTRINRVDRARDWLWETAGFGSARGIEWN